MKPKYSFVMPAYKAEFIKESIQSILNQEYTGFELVIVDDCSPQDIQSIVKGFSDERIHYYRNEENIGGKDLVRQWNHSVEYASGKWIILATDDDVYDKKFLSTADTLLNKYPQADIFRARVFFFEQDIDDVWRAEPSMSEYVTLEEYAYSLERFLLGGIPQFVFRRSALNAIGGFVNFPLAWYSDEATSIKLSENGIVCSSQELVFFRFSGLNLSTEGKYVGEKLLSRFLFDEYFYNQILARMNSANQNKYQKYYSKCLYSLYPFRIKERLLIDIYQLPLRKRINYLKIIDAHTPYLSKRNKLIMKIRLFMKL